MIVCGYPLVGKSTAAKRFSNVVDLESSWFHLEGGKNIDGVTQYCQMARALSEQGKVVLISCHKAVRDMLEQSGCEFALWYPAVDLKLEWLHHAWERYRRTDLVKDMAAAERVEKFFEQDIVELEAYDCEHKLVIRNSMYLDCIWRKDWGFPSAVVNFLAGREHETNKIITLCGSMKFRYEFKLIEAELRGQGYMVLTPIIFDMVDNNIAFNEEMHKSLDEIHRRKIDMSCKILVVNIGDYIGTDTQSEIDYAKSKGIPVEYYRAHEEKE